jgi:hypothetical protein
MIVLASCDINDVGASVSTKSSTNRVFSPTVTTAGKMRDFMPVNDVGGIFGRFFVS